MCDTKNETKSKKQNKTNQTNKNIIIFFPLKLLMCTVRKNNHFIGLNFVDKMCTHVHTV